MPNGPSDHVPGHVRRRLASGDGIAFVEVGEPPATPAEQDSVHPSKDLLRVVEMAMLTLSIEPGPVRALPFITGVGEGLDACALPEGDGIRLTVARSGTPPDGNAGILLRRAPEPDGGLYTLSGRGADGRMGCNPFVASHVIGLALGRMSDEIRALDGGYGLVDVPGLHGSLFDQAFPGWKVSDEASTGPGDAPPVPPMP